MNVFVTGANVMRKMDRVCRVLRRSGEAISMMPQTNLKSGLIQFLYWFVENVRVFVNLSLLGIRNTCTQKITTQLETND